jgi:LacI family transcriptional regulator
MAQQRRRATQREVAQLAGVSQATVSLALAGSATQSIPQGTLDRVLNAARELGYVPNRFAQGLKTSRTMTLACVVPDIANPFYPTLMRGVQIVADQEGYDVIALNTGADAERERRVLEWGLQGRVDGIIGVFFTLRSTDFEPLTRAGLGVLRIEASAKSGGALPIDNLFVDNTAAAIAAVRYLIEKGHTRIAMITGTGGPQDHRMQGYRRTVLEAGLAPNVAVHPSFDEEGGYRATRDILLAPQRPTAIFAANDMMAIGAMSALREAGLRVPDDMAVMGFDDIFAARVLTPALSTVNQFQHALGQVAARMMLQRLTELPPDMPGRHREMPFEIVQRQSA